MKNKLTRNKMRIGTMINLISLITFMLIWELTAEKGNFLFFAVEAIAFIIFLASYIRMFWMTKLWKFIHLNIKKLDERDLKITGYSLRFSYAAFSILVLSLLLYYSITEYSVGIIPVGALIYLAHIFPAYYLAWTEEIV